MLVCGTPCEKKVLRRDGDLSELRGEEGALLLARALCSSSSPTPHSPRPRLASCLAPPPPTYGHPQGKGRETWLPYLVISLSPMVSPSSVTVPLHTCAHTLLLLSIKPLRAASQQHVLIIMGNAIPGCLPCAMSSVGRWNDLARLSVTPTSFC